MTIHETEQQACHCCLPRIPSCRIVHGLCFAPDDVLSIMCIVCCLLVCFLLVWSGMILFVWLWLGCVADRFGSSSLTFLASSPLTFLRAPKLVSMIVAMLSNGFLVTWMNFIGTWTTLLISSRMLILAELSDKISDVLPPFLSPITL